MNPNKSDQRKLEIVLAISTGFGFPSNTTVWVLGHISTRPETIFEDMPLERSTRDEILSTKVSLIQCDYCDAMWIVVDRLHRLEPSELKTVELGAREILDSEFAMIVLGAKWKFRIAPLQSRNNR